MTNVRMGIDPDLVKSGVCLIKHEIGKQQEIVDLKNLEFYDLLEVLKCGKKLYEEHNDKVKSFTVFLEAGWLNKKSNYHNAFNKEIAGRIGKNVGENHAVGKLIEQFCKREDIDCRLIKPTTKKWDAKIFKKITKWQGRTNSEMRDAVRAAWL